MLSPRRSVRAGIDKPKRAATRVIDTVSSELDVQQLFAGFAVLIVFAVCVAYGLTMTSLRGHPWAEVPAEDRDTMRAEWIVLGTTFLLFVSTAGLLIAGRVWMPLLLFFSALAGMIAFQRLDLRRLAEAKLFSMIDATLTLTVAAISFGRATIGGGMGPFHASVVLVLGTATAYAVSLISKSQHRH